MNPVSPGNTVAYSQYQDKDSSARKSADQMADTEPLTINNKKDTSIQERTVTGNKPPKISYGYTSLYFEEPVTVFLNRFKYYDGSCGLSLKTEDGEEFIRCSVSFSSADIRTYFHPDFNEEASKADLILVRDYAENEGCLEFLTENGIVEIVGSAKGFGSTNFPIAKIL